MASTNLHLYPGEQIKKAGNYILRNDSNKIGISFNYDRIESETASYSNDELEDIAKSLDVKNFNIDKELSSLFTGGMADLSNSRTLWKLCSIFAIAFFAIETILLRYWKTEKE
ncbi:MAG: hypothetical protein HRT72_02955 [Flavobacteriales bacterium]|nr:hypothetical protein [Flavobacteriales bacterium]